MACSTYPPAALSHLSARLRHKYSSRESPPAPGEDSLELSQSQCVVLKSVWTFRRLGYAAVEYRAWPWWSPSQSPRPRTRVGWRCRSPKAETTSIASIWRCGRPLPLLPPLPVCLELPHLLQALFGGWSRGVPHSPCSSRCTLDDRQALCARMKC